nr:SPOR domain-containing protein [uncultured Desulfobacter sp.]
MFALGVFVGRGSSPVLFETRPFQERLGRMVSEISAKLPVKQKVDLKFYDVLDEPESYPVKGKTDDSGEITPGPETGKTVSIKPAPYHPQAEEIPVKRSRKLATWHQAGQRDGKNVTPAPLPKKTLSVKTDAQAGKKQTVSRLAPKDLKSKIQTGKRTNALPKETRPDNGKVPAPAPAPAHGAYTIQVASYKTLDDALAQMVILDKKGIAAYRASAKVNGNTWYRVRIGTFADYKAARVRLEKLAGSGVTGIVIKKE